MENVALSWQNERKDAWNSQQQNMSFVHSMYLLASTTTAMSADGSQEVDKSLTWTLARLVCQYSSVPLANCQFSSWSSFKSNERRPNAVESRTRYKLVLFTFILSLHVAAAAKAIQSSCRFMSCSNKHIRNRMKPKHSSNKKIQKETPRHLKNHVPYGMPGNAVGILLFAGILKSCLGVEEI